MIRLAVILCALLCLEGCIRFSQPGSDIHPARGIGAELVTLGRWFLWAGAAIGVVGMAARVAFTVSRFAAVGAAIAKIPIIGPILQAFAAFIASLGFLAFAFGICSIWLADNLWAFVLALVIAALAVAYAHRRSIRRWLGIRQTPEQKDAP